MLSGKPVLIGAGDVEGLLPQSKSIAKTMATSKARWVPFQESVVSKVSPGE